jgi:hypothetical protein
VRKLSLVAALLLMQLVARAANPPYVDLTAQFARFADETAGMNEKARVALFRKKFDALLPGFYQPRNAGDPARYDARVARELHDFTALRARYEQTQRDFPAAYAAGLAHFQKVFPGFQPNVPVYFLHSLGEMDGGTRKLGRRVYLIFGADVIAQIHEARELTPFLDHELFHVENGKYFSDCEQVWCTLWAEGLATYAARSMNPGADDRQLLLTSPAPIRAAVDATWPAAACTTRAKLFSSKPEDLDTLFAGGAAGSAPFPERFGYYVGLRAIEELGGKYGLPELAHMPPERAKESLTAALDRLIANKGCK